ncbi:MAG: hypothetical protein ABR551_10830 [Gemmatimonadales bacterium]
MGTLLKLLLLVHVAGGMVGLVSFWVPAVARKGGPLHRRAGRVYVYGMGLVAMTGVPLAISTFAQGDWIGGTFLLYLVVITTTALYTGLRALRSKSGPAQLITPTYRALAGLNLGSGVVTLALGVGMQIWLLAGFSLIGLLTGQAMLAFIRKPPTDPRYWWYEHFGGMIGSGIAAHVAFLNFGARRMIPGYSLGDWGMLAWFVPVVVGVVAISRTGAYYKRKFAGSGKGQAVPAEA